jgi:hypothetical protein
MKLKTIPRAQQGKADPHSADHGSISGSAEAEKKTQSKRRGRSPTADADRTVADPKGARHVLFLGWSASGIISSKGTDLPAPVVACKPGRQ